MECPVCSRVFPASSINVHVNECLSEQDTLDSEDTESISKAATGGSSCATVVHKSTTSSNYTSTKRKGSDNWGSLQPMRRGRQRDANVVSPSSSKKAKIKPVASANPRPQVDGGVRIVLDTESDSSEESHATKGVSLPLSRAASGPASTKAPVSQSLQQCGGRQLQPAARPMPVSSAAECFAPLAERMRPQSLEEYVGQEGAVGRDSMLYYLLASHHIPSIILWGPPGCGKTTLAKIIANNCRSRGNAKFMSLSAAVCGVNEVKDTIKIARNDQKMFRRKTIMFLDEIHRFNKAQQDVLLPHVEDGTITLIGATTENPSFQVNSALLSRCRVIVLEKLSAESILSILHRALAHVGATVADPQHASPSPADGSDRSEVGVDRQALELLSQLVDGDARAALNGLQMAVEARRSGPGDGADGLSPPGRCVVTVEDIKEGLQRSHVLYDKTGEEHYNIISALHKSMRGSDTSAALYWLARMLEGGENPLYIARRLIRFASEDVGLADPQALPQAVAAYQGCHLIGMPECEVLLAQCTVYLARAPKSVEVYKAYGRAKACVRDHKGPLPSVPLHLRNAPTRLMKNLGYSKGYKYNPDYSEPVDQAYFPEELHDTSFFT